MTISELIDVRGRLSVSEAVAIVLALIDSFATASGTELREPYGPPTPDNVELRADGSVICTACATTPAVSEVAIFVQTLLAHTAKIPGGLRYAVGRALLEVEAPPFDSLDEFARSLARFEGGERPSVLRAMVERALEPRDDDARAPVPALRVLPMRQPVAPPAPAPSEPVDRRLHGPRADQLRRELRAADQLLFTRTFADRVPVQAAADAKRGSAWTSFAAAAVLLIMIGAGGFILWPHPGAVATRGQAPSVPSVPVATTAARSRAAAPGQASAPTPVRTERGVDRGAQSSPAERGSDRADRAADRTPARPSESATPAVANVSEGHATADEGWLVPTLDVHRRPVFSPSFASNGSAVFFHTGGNGDARSALMSADTSGDQLRVMTILDDGARNYHVQPSPDGRQIAFDSDRDGDRGVYVANRDGSNVRRVSGPGFAAVPTWSPDGGALAFVRAEPNDARVWNLWLLNLTTGASTKLTNYRYGQPWAASWFPDGGRIAYTHEDHLYILDLQTHHTDTFNTPVAGHLLRTPAVSPDGSRIVFQVAHNGVWMLDLGDRSMRCVLQDPTAEEFAWAPDGRRVAFHSRRDGQWGVYVMAKKNN